MLKFISIILVFFLGGCWTKCGLHYDYHCQCKEYYDVSGQYIKECPYDDVKETIKQQYKQQQQMNNNRQNQQNTINNIMGK